MLIVWTKGYLYYVGKISIALQYLTIIPRVRMGYESIAHEAEGRMGYWFRGHEGERNNCFSKIHLVGQKNIETKHLSQAKARHVILEVRKKFFAAASSVKKMSRFEEDSPYGLVGYIYQLISGTFSKNNC